jgi:hypothetical protein
MLAAWITFARCARIGRRTRQSTDLAAVRPTFFPSLAGSVRAALALRNVQNSQVPERLIREPLGPVVAGQMPAAATTRLPATKNRRQDGRQKFAARRVLSEAEWEYAARFFEFRAEWPSPKLWEWVEDCYHDNYVGAPSDGSPWRDYNGLRDVRCHGDLRVARGGPETPDPEQRLTVRNKLGEFDYKFYGHFGIRVARSLPSRSRAPVGEAAFILTTAVPAQIATRLRKASDFRGSVVSSRLWWRFSPPLLRSSPSAFVAAPRWNLSLLPCDIR